MPQLISTYKASRVKVIKFTVEFKDGSKRVAEFHTHEKILDILTDFGSLGELLRALCK